MAQTIRVNKPKGGMTTSASLFNLYKEYDAGQINADKFSEKMQNDIGVRPTEEFQNYLRTTKGQGRCEFSKIQKTLKVATKQTQPVLADVRPLDIKFHRGQANHGLVTSPRVLSPRQSSPRHVQLTSAIKDYTNGRTDLGQFRLALAGKVQIDGKLERLLRQHEAGDTVSFSTLGTLVFRQLDGQCDSYNRVDKISMNDPSQVAPANSARAFYSPQELPKRKKKVTDKMQMDDEWRNATGVYQPVRGGAARTDIFGSNLFSVINQEESARTGANREWETSKKKKNTKMMTSDASLFGWDVDSTTQSQAARSSFCRSDY